MNTTRNHHAVVLGGSIAGLMAARILSDHFDRVTVIERDRLAQDGEVRSAVPQGLHVHGMLSKGLDVIEAMLPGFTKDLLSHGATLCGPHDVSIYIAGWRKPHDAPIKVLIATRPFIEWSIARQVRAQTKVEFLEETEATGLNGTAERVTGVKLIANGVERTLDADFIVDARGRRSNLADWLKLLGAEPPPHETSPLSSVYCSCMLEPAPGSKPFRPLQVADFNAKIGALMFPVERNRVLLSVGANASIDLPRTHDEMLALLRDRLPVPDAYDAMKTLKPLTPLAHSRFTASVRRNFDALAKPPQGIVAIGDAIASFNPIFGQGMTVAALEAEMLGKCLAKSNPTENGFAQTYYAAVKPIVDAAWGLPDLEAKRNNPAAQPLATRFLLWYTDRMQRAASRSVHASRVIAEVQNMLSPPAALFGPSVFFQVLRG